MLLLHARNMVTAELISVTVLVGIIYITNHVWKSMTYWKVRGVKHRTPLPLVGNMLRAFKFDKHFFHLYDKLYHTFPEERMVGMYEFTTPTLVLRDPELIKTVLVSEFSTFSDRGPLLFNPDCVLYSSIFALKGNKWRAIRNKVLTPFTTGRLKSLFPSVTGACMAFVDSDPKELTLDIIKQLTLRIFSQTMFGVELKSAEADILRKNLGKMMAASKTKLVQQIGLMYFPRLCDFMSFKFMPVHLDNYFRSLLNAILNKKVEDSSWRNDVIRILNQMRKDGKINFYDKVNNKEEIFDVTDELAQAQALFLLVAAVEPSSLVLIHLAYDLAQSPDCQTKARQEVKAQFKKYGEYSWECVKDMKYLNCCLKETLRLHPPLQFLNRVCNRYTELGGVKLKKGTRIVVPLHVLHLDSNYFPDPKTYKPERFLEDKQHKFIYLPFSEGPRMCLGSRFFILEALILFAQILDKFELSLSKEMKLPLKYEPNTVFLTPKYNNPVIINLKRIT
ncbi:cytochrome P450 6B1 [Halyomorpha halys]|uniref:cytochrome P450 6B1 n=1 Tax=Halyomorpha halys TaxID=286706 RepID=UPI0034D383A5